MEIRRFGIGYRRPDGPPGTTGVTGQSIHNDQRGYVGELALARDARIEPPSNPNTTYFIVIEGGGFVQVGEEVARVAAGEAVVWPAGIEHAAWTVGTQMRAIVVEFGTLEGVHRDLLLEGAALALPARGGRGEGKLAPKVVRRPKRAGSAEGEPW